MGLRISQEYLFRPTEEEFPTALHWTPLTPFHLYHPTANPHNIQHHRRNERNASYAVHSSWWVGPNGVAHLPFLIGPLLSYQESQSWQILAKPVNPLHNITRVIRINLFLNSGLSKGTKL